MEPTSIVIGVVIGLIIGGVAVFLFSKGLLKKEKEGMLEEIKSKQESIKQEKILQELMTALDYINLQLILLEIQQFQFLKALKKQKHFLSEKKQTLKYT